MNVDFKHKDLPVLGVNESEVLSIKVNPCLPFPNSAVHLSVLRLKLLESCPATRRFILQKNLAEIVKAEFSEEGLPHMSVMVVYKLLSRVHRIYVVRGFSRTRPAVVALA